MRGKRNFECSKVFVTLGCLLLFSLTSPVLAADYVYIDSGDHDIDYAIGGYLGVANATVNLLSGSHIESLGVDGDIYALDGSIINITGCIVDGVLFITPTSTVTFYGSEFVLDGTPLDPTTVEIVNTSSSSAAHQLSGLYDDGTEFTINIDLDPLAKISLYWPIVSPLKWDYGEVAIGESPTCVVTIMNVESEDLEVYSVTFPDGSADFTITDAPAAPFTIPPGESRDIQITFTPSTEDYVERIMSIESNDAVRPIIEVKLSGAGVVVSIPPVQQIEVISEFFNLSIENGTLLGYGPSNSPEKRLKALRNMMKAVSDLISLEYYAQAAEQLGSIAKKTDGEKRPPDFVIGEAVATLNAKIESLIADLSS